MRKVIRSSIIIILFFALYSFTVAYGQETTVRLALMKYSGGGDWYANPSSLPNLIKFCNQNINTSIDPDAATVEPGSRDIFFYPFVHLTGHGNVVFSDQEANNIRNYLMAGGFLHIDDNYGLDPFIRREMKKVFPELDFTELPVTHPIFKNPYQFQDGLPKIHEHDKKRPQAFGLLWEGRLICFYSYESDLGDGWEEREVHYDSDAIRLRALQMGANLIHYVFTER